MSCGLGFGLAGWGGEPGVSVDGSGDDVESCQSVVSGGIEVAANAAPAGQGPRGMPRASAKSLVSRSGLNVNASADYPCFRELEGLRSASAAQDRTRRDVTKIAAAVLGRGGSRRPGAAYGWALAGRSWSIRDDESPLWWLGRVIARLMDSRLWQNDSWCGTAFVISGGRGKRGCDGPGR